MVQLSNEMEQSTATLVKKCSRCKEDRSVSEFHKRARWCKSCKKAYDQVYIQDERVRGDRLRKKKIWHRSPEGHARKLYSMLKNRLKNDPHYAEARVTFTLEELLKFLLNHPEYLRIHAKWVKNDYSLSYTPTLDRIDEDNYTYSLDTIQVLTFVKNGRKASVERASKEGRYVSVTGPTKRKGEYNTLITHKKKQYSAGKYQTAEHAAIAINKVYDLLQIDEDLIFYNQVPEEFYETFVPHEALLTLGRQLSWK